VADGLGPWNALDLERRSRLRNLDDLLEALEALNLHDAPVISAAVAARLDELGIQSTSARAPFTELVDGVFKAQERFMIDRPTEGRVKRRWPPFDARTLRLRRD
jgi:hypothetical protein